MSQVKIEFMILKENKESVGGDVSRYGGGKMKSHIFSY